MLMMKIEMNADKIQAEQRYTISAINRTIESAFAQMKLRKVEDASGALLYRDSGDRKSTRLNSSHKHRSRMPSSA